MLCFHALFQILYFYSRNDISYNKIKCCNALYCFICKRLVAYFLCAIRTHPHLVFRCPASTTITLFVIGVELTFTALSLSIFPRVRQENINKDIESTIYIPFFNVSFSLSIFFKFTTQYNICSLFKYNIFHLI